MNTLSIVLLAIGLTKKKQELANVKSELEYLQRKVVWLTEEVKEMSQ